jgi:hypothetical protein
MRVKARKHSLDGEMCDPEHPASICTDGGEAITNAVRSPVRPATRWMCVVSRASARVIVGRMVVMRRASIDFSTPGGPRSKRL